MNIPDFKVFNYVCCMFLNVLPECVNVHYVGAWCQHEVQRGPWNPRTGVTDCCKLPY